jgi:hypothetical protein
LAKNSPGRHGGRRGPRCAAWWGSVRTRSGPATPWTTTSVTGLTLGELLDGATNQRFPAGFDSDHGWVLTMEASATGNPLRPSWLSWIQMSSSPSRAVVLALLSFTTVACGPSGSDSVPDSATDLVISDIEIDLSEVVPTVAVVSWRTSEPSTGRVAFGPVGDLVYETATSTEPATEHQATLVGLKQASQAALVITASTDAGSVVSEEQPFETGLLPAGTPSIEHSVYDAEAAYGGFLIAPFFQPQAGWICLLDPDGEVVWAYESEFGAHRVLPTLDGAGLVYMHTVPPESEPPLGLRLVRLDWTGRELQRRTTEKGHHDFALIDDDHFAMLGQRTTVLAAGTEDELTVVSDTIETMGWEDEPVVLWDILDHLDPYQIPGVRPEASEDPGVTDWSHGNFLHHDPERGRYLVVLRHLDAIIAVDDESGDQLWALSNSWGDFHGADGEILLQWPHSVEPVGDDLWVFNQTYDTATEACSDAKLLTLDADSGTATTTRVYTNDECSKCEYLGSTHLLSDGDILVSFSQAGLIDQVSPSGELVARTSTSFGHQVAYLTPLDTLQLAAPVTPEE